MYYVEIIRGGLLEREEPFLSFCTTQYLTYTSRLEMITFSMTAIKLYVPIVYIKPMYRVSIYNTL